MTKPHYFLPKAMVVCTVLTRGLAVLGCLYITYALYEYVRHPLLYQNDFKIYYYSARAFALGSNPYDPDTLKSFYPERFPLPYIYPPLTLFAFKPWASLPVHWSYELWLICKVLVTGGLLCLWNRRFLRLTWLAVPFLLTGFNGAFLIDLEAGNISVWEQGVLWAGFAFLLAGRVWPFCLCIILVSQFKISPAVFLILLLFLPERPQWRPLVISSLICGGLLAANLFLYPGLTRQWRLATVHSDERGAINPALLAFIRDMGNTVTEHGLPLPHGASTAVYLLAAGGILLMSLRAVRHYRRVCAAPDPRLQLFFSCLVYALVLPRFKSYSYILLLPAVWEALPWLWDGQNIGSRFQRALRLAALSVAAVFFFAAPFYIELAVARTPLSIPMQLMPYCAFFLALILWGVYVRRLSSEPDAPDDLPPVGA